MKRFFLLLILSAGIIACNRSSETKRTLQARIDSLEKKLADTYKPGFGEFMSNIQVHHAKLWFAGQAKNWKLAGFEVHEMMEALEDVQQFRSEREESKKLSMLNPSLDSVMYAVGQQNSVAFKSSFILLTNTCNNCHRATDFGFNVVKIPSSVPFSNQSFEPIDSVKK
jgi:hypothetical protein